VKRLTALLMKGLATVLPIGLTAYALWWLATSTETLLRSIIMVVVPAEQYRPGMGILVGVLVLLGVGTLVNAYVVKRALSYWEDLLSRIPLVKTVYGAFRDMMRLLPSGESAGDLQTVVTVRIGEGRMLGFVTRDRVPEIPHGGADLVAVYFPLSYMLGGVTMFVPRNVVEHVDMPVEAAMRLVLTGGMGKSPGETTTGAPPTA